MLVSCCVHPLIGRHGQDEDLVHLAHSETGDPHAVEHRHDHHEEDPGGAQGCGLQVVKVSLLVLRVGTGRGQVDVAPVRGEERQTRQQNQVEYEEVVILLTDTVTNPGTVVVKPGDASITDGAVLRPDGSLDETRAAEYHGVEAVTLRQLDESPVLHLLACADDPYETIVFLVSKTLTD